MGLKERMWKEFYRNIGYLAIISIQVLEQFLVDLILKLIVSLNVMTTLSGFSRDLKWVSGPLNFRLQHYFMAIRPYFQDDLSIYYKIVINVTVI